MDALTRALISVRTFFWSLRDEDDGASMVEYGLLVALIAIAVIVALTALGGGLSGLFGDVADEVSNAGN